MEKNYIIAGFGGQGVLFAGKIIANAFMIAGKNVTWYPCYGAEMRGGTVNCEIVVADDEVSSVHKQDADCIIVLNQLSFDRFVTTVKPGGRLICNSSLVEENRPRNDIEYTFIPMTDKAIKFGNHKLTNMVALGVLSNTERELNMQILEEAVDIVLPQTRKNLLQTNIDAIKLGIEKTMSAI